VLLALVYTVHKQETEREREGKEKKGVRGVRNE
jgi:hypothetical protein